MITKMKFQGSPITTNDLSENVYLFLFFVLLSSIWLYSIKIWGLWIEVPSG